MKKYLSVFEMITRSSIYQVLFIFILMAAAQLGSFVCIMQTWEKTHLNLEEMIAQSHFALFLGIAYLAVTVVLILPGCNIGSVKSYTLQRLRISEKCVYCLQSLYHICCYTLLWGTQLAVLLFSANLYLKYQTYAKVTNQTVFLAFHRSAFMHSILPIDDIEGWWLLVFLIVGTGIAAAAFSWQQRRGKIERCSFLIAAISIVAFPRELGSKTGWVMVSVGVIVMLLFYRKRKDQKREERMNVYENNFKR